jgi:hypothetical protein
MPRTRNSLCCLVLLLAAVVPVRAQGSDATGDSLAAGAVPTWRKVLAVGAHVGMYGVATKVGSRFGLERRFKIVRLEKAYAYDIFAHAWSVNQLSQLFAGLDEWAGMSPSTARRTAAWGTAFGALTYMEFINGFMPDVRFDPADPLANALGALIATEGPVLAARHPWMRRLSFEFGYKDLDRTFGPQRDSGFAGNLWHDYPNGRFGIGYGIGPLEHEWFRVFATYEITSMDVETLRNRFGVGLELKPHHWLEPGLDRLPGGSSLVAAIDWLDRRFLLPGLYLQLWTFDTGPFSDQELFRE